MTELGEGARRYKLRVNVPFSPPQIPNLLRDRLIVYTHFVSSVRLTKPAWTYHWLKVVHRFVDSLSACDNLLFPLNVGQRQAQVKVQCFLDSKFSKGYRRCCCACGCAWMETSIRSVGQGSMSNQWCWVSSTCSRRERSIDQCACLVDDRHAIQGTHDHDEEEQERAKLERVGRLVKTYFLT